MSVQDDAVVEKRSQVLKNIYLESEGDAVTVIDCGSSLDISMVKEFSEALKQAIARGKPLILDAEYVENADGAALQLLYAFFLEARVKELDLSWKVPSEALKRSAKLLGLSDQIKLH